MEQSQEYETLSCLQLDVALAEIQSRLRAPKNQRNSFGNYNYRSCEDILEALKPLLDEHGLCLILSDRLEEVGGRVYVVATAIVRGYGKQITADAYAREPESRKGMDSSQLTGSTSSYARKYALNGLFAIDDNRDADAVNTHGKKETGDTVQKCEEALTSSCNGHSVSDALDYLIEIKVIEEKARAYVSTWQDLSNEVPPNVAGRIITNPKGFFGQIDETKKAIKN